MKAVLISIQPKWVEKIANGEKTIEVRKTAPKQVPFKCYIYCTSSDVHSALVVGDGDTKLIHCCNYKSAIPVGGVIGNGKVIGDFVCDEVERFSVGSLRSDDIEKLACLSYSEMIDYFYKPEELDGKTAKQGYAWHISDLKIYDKPKDLSEFKVLCNVKTDCHNCPYYNYNKMDCDSRVITRPPQSWQYVEGLEK